MTQNNTAIVDTTPRAETLDLTVDPSTYCPDWSWKEGLREVGQNLWDSDRRGARAEVKWTAAHGSWTLDLINHGASLSRRALVMGGTDKRDDISQVGYHGDGLKSGAMAILRAGCQLAVRTADERWNFSTAWSDQFESQVLRVSVTTLYPEVCPHVAVTITGLPYEARDYWDILFIPAPTPGPGRTLDSMNGEWLDQGPNVSRLYQGGVLIDETLGSRWGSLSLPNKRLKLDRDRNVVQADRLLSSAVEALGESLKSRRERGEDVGSQLFRFLMEEPDSLARLDQGIQRGAATMLALDFGADVLHAFRGQFGDSGVVVDSLSEANQAKHLGLTPVQKEQLFRFFCYTDCRITDSVLGEKRIRAAIAAITAGSSVPVEAMSALQQDSFRLALRYGETLDQWCAGRVRKPRAEMPPLVIIAASSDASYYDPNGTLALSLGHLSYGSGTTLATLCHELAHRWSGASDLTPEHTRMMERIFGYLIEAMS